jgi:acyl carrier protein
MQSKSKEQIVKALLEETEIILSAKKGEISPDVALEDLGLDSLSLIEIFVFIESSFGVKLIETGATIEDLKNIESIAQCVLNNIK